MALGSLAYVCALIGVSRGIESRPLLLVCLFLAVVWRVAIVPATPLLSDDVYRYLWDGRVQRFGYDPYRSAPDDPALDHLHIEATRRIDPTSAALPTIYPPAAELFFRGVTAVHESTTAIVIAVVAFDLLTMLILWRWLATTGRSPWWVLAYAWHPLVAIEGAGGGHIDVVGTCLVVVTGFALSRRRGLLATSALAAAFAIKFLPVVLAPLLWRRVSLRDALGGVGLVGGGVSSVSRREPHAARRLPWRLHRELAFQRADLRLARAAAWRRAGTGARDRSRFRRGVHSSADDVCRQPRRMGVALGRIVARHAGRLSVVSLVVDTISDDSRDLASRRLDARLDVDVRCVELRACRNRVGPSQLGRSGGVRTRCGGRAMDLALFRILRSPCRVIEKTV